MPPSNTMPFLIAAEKSGLFASERLSTLSHLATSERNLVQQLLDRDELTQFQADKLQAGLWQGLTLGPYRVLAPIGRGGMGIVYLAAKGADNQSPRVALKILPPRIAKEEPRRLARFLREIRIGQAISPHPRIARTLEGSVVNGVHYLAMEYVPGITLRKQVQENGPLSTTEAATLAVQLADGLAQLHSVHIIHRDFKPANVMIRPDGYATILDFGFALVLGEPIPADPSIAGGKGYVIGTMDYIAPEQILDSTNVTPASDLYSLGCTLFFALTGTPPYPGGDVQQKLRWHRQSEPPNVRTIQPDVPVEIANLVARLLDKDPERRPESVKSVGEALRPFAKELNPEPEVAIVESAVNELTHRKADTELILEPIILDEPIEEAGTDSPTPLFWYFIAGLVFLIVILVSAMGFLLIAKR